MRDDPTNKNLTERKNIELMRYEEALSELETIVTDLELSEHTLDEAVALFERGQALSRHCSNLLDQSELKVKKLLGDEFEDFQLDDSP